MVYKWCVVPQCTSTSIKDPSKLFVSVPTNPKKRKMWLQLARIVPKSVLSHSNVFMYEDHFHMEKDTNSNMKHEMDYSQNILVADEAVPSKFHCQDDRKRRLSCPEHSQEPSPKRQRSNLITECLDSQNSETYAERLQKDDNIVQPTIESEEIPKTQDKGTMTTSVTTAEKSVQTNIKIHYRSKNVQTKSQSKSVSTSTFKVSTTSTSTSPIKIVQPRHVEPLQFGHLLEDENSDSDISCIESGHLPSIATPSSRVTDSVSYTTDTDENIE